MTFRTRSTLVRLTIVLTCGALAATGITHPAQARETREAAAPLRTIQVLAGSVDVSRSTSAQCTYPEGSCGDYPGGVRRLTHSDRESDDISFSVHSPSSAQPLSAGSTRVTAPLTIDHWAHSYRSQTTDDGCQGTTTTIEDSGAPEHAGNAPSFFNLALDVEVKETPEDIDVSLAPREATEPRFGWEYPLGFRWDDSTRYSTVTQTRTIVVGPEPSCSGLLEQTERPLLNPIEPLVDHTDSVAPPSIEVMPGCTWELCRWQISGQTTSSHSTTAPLADGFSGSTVTRWSAIVQAASEVGDCGSHWASYDGKLDELRMFSYSNEVQYCRTQDAVTIGDAGAGTSQAIYPAGFGAALDLLGVSFPYRGSDPPVVTSYGQGGAEVSVRGSYSFCIQLPTAIIKNGALKAIEALPRPLRKKVSNWLDRGIRFFVRRVLNSRLAPDWLVEKSYRKGLKTAIDHLPAPRRHKDALRALVEFSEDYVQGDVEDYIVALIFDGVCVPKVWTPKVSIFVPVSGTPTDLEDGTSALFTTEPTRPR